MPTFYYPHHTESLVHLHPYSPLSLSHNFACACASFDLLGWNTDCPMQTPLSVPLNEMLSLLTDAVASRNLLCPDSARWYCFFVNPSSVGPWYQRFVSVTRYFHMYLLLLIYLLYPHPCFSLVSTRVFYHFRPSSSSVIVLLNRRPHHPTYLSDTVTHLYRHIKFSHISNTPQFFCRCYYTLHLYYTPGNLPGYATYIIMNSFFFLTILHMQI